MISKNSNERPHKRLENDCDPKTLLGIKRSRENNLKMTGDNDSMLQTMYKRPKRGSFGNLPRSQSLPMVHTYDPTDITKSKRIFSLGSQVNLLTLKTGNVKKQNHTPSSLKELNTSVKNESFDENIFKNQKNVDSSSPFKAPKMYTEHTESSQSKKRTFSLIFEE